ncbi:MAG: hypothetical protein KAX65_00135 [Caldilineaceae bacterium]|nr:hypothetical protein [Caldilineaceae bacterium]
MLYLSPVWNSLLEQYRPRFGYMMNAAHRSEGPYGGVLAGYPWLLDNGAYSDAWKVDQWVAGLERWAAHRSTCIAAVVPDTVGDAQATLAKFAEFAPTVRQYGYPVAFVTQDGLRLEDVPWSDFDVMFVGGTNQHKLHESMPFILEAKRRGKWVHIGRVNSAKRMHQFWIADSCDGTSMKIEPSPRYARLYIHAMEEIKGKKATCSMF